MPRQISERERLLTYAMSATEAQLEEALEIFKVALKQSKAPTTKKTSTAKPKKGAPSNESAQAASAGSGTEGQGTV